MVTLHNMQGKLIYRNSPTLEEILLLDGQGEVANVQTPISQTPIRVALLLDLLLQHRSDLQLLHWEQKQMEV
jgi:hypothetical protein